MRGGARLDQAMLDRMDLNEKNNHERFAAIEHQYHGFLQRDGFEAQFTVRCQAVRYRVGNCLALDGASVTCAQHDMAVPSAPRYSGGASAMIASSRMRWTIAC